MAGRGRGRLLMEALAMQAAAAEQANLNSNPSDGAVSSSSSSTSVRRSTVMNRLRQRFEQNLTLEGPPAAPSSSGYASQGPGPVSLDSNVSSDSVALSSSSRSSSIQNQIKYEGNNGQAIKVRTNSMKLLTSEVGIYEFNVLFQPEIDEREERFFCIKRLVKDHKLGSHHFNGFHIFFPQKLINNKDFPVMNSKGMLHKVTLQFVCLRQFSDKLCLDLFNNLFRQVMAALKFVQMNRSGYDPKAASSVPHLKLEIWPGFITSVDETKGGLQLTCDVSHRILRQETVLELMKNIYNHKKGGDWQSEIQRQLIGEMVLTRYNHRVYRIDEVDFKKCPTDTFPRGDSGLPMAYAKYYKEAYGIEIKDLKQPLLISRSKRRATGETVERTICLIPEICHLTGLSEVLRQEFRIMRELATFTRKTPAQRAESLAKFIHSVKANPVATKILKSWHLTLSNEPISLNGRVLDPQSIHFGGDYRERVSSKADWSRAVSSKPLLTSVTIDHWLIIHPDRCRDAAKNFTHWMRDLTQRMKWKVMAPTVVILKDDRSETLLEGLRKNLDRKMKIVVAIFPQQRSDRYAAFKKYCCVDFPIPSQVIVAKTLENMSKGPSIAQKIGMQMNVKLGGELWGIPSLINGLMVVGIDVYHDKSQKMPSVAAVVATMNNTSTQWASQVVFQDSKQELVDGLRAALVKLLEAYYQRNTQWPTSMIVFRDGIGDSQIETSGRIELDQLARTFFKVTEITHRKFGFVVVQKRIMTRLIDAGGDNPPPGTVVDQIITKKQMKDFFLVSQKVNQGTVSPTHYVVVDGGEEKVQAPPADLVQKLAYQQTHMYYNWPGTVRVPAACLYAHKLANLVGEHIKRAPSNVLYPKLFFL